MVELGAIWSIVASQVASWTPTVVVWNNATSQSGFLHKIQGNSYFPIVDASSDMLFIAFSSIAIEGPVLESLIASHAFNSVEEYFELSFILFHI